MNQEDYLNYEDTEENYTGYCYMSGSQGVDGSKFDIIIEPPYTEINGKTLVCIEQL